ncbi:regulatory protein [Phyllosticta capitalensis]
MLSPKTDAALRQTRRKSHSNARVDCTSPGKIFCPDTNAYRIVAPGEPPPEPEGLCAHLLHDLLLHDHAKEMRSEAMGTWLLACLSTKQTMRRDECPVFLVNYNKPEDFLNGFDGSETAYGDVALELSRFLDTAGINFDLDLFASESQVFPTLSPETLQPATFDDPHPSIPNEDMGEVERKWMTFLSADDFNELKPFQLPWRVHEQQVREFREQLAAFRDIFPDGFQMPSRISISRYIAGFVDGLSHHFPFIHMSTFSITAYHDAPELVLSLLAVGAQYRYERKSASSLYAASRAIIKERIKRGEVPDLRMTFNEALPHSPPNLLATTGAILLLMKFSAWQADPGLILESLNYRPLLAHCVRRAGLSEASPDDGDDWLTWTKLETDRRTKLCVFCYLNLQELAFAGVEPVLLASEVRLRLPSSCREWLAESQSEWMKARREGPAIVEFSHALTCVLRAPHTAQEEHFVPVTSPFGNFILIHALLQRIALARRLAFEASSLFRPTDAAELSTAFDRWRLEWQRAPESVLNVRNSKDSLAFASTALFGLAHIRLHFALPSEVNFQSCNPKSIALGAYQATPPRRGPHLLKALLHATHALSAPVQMGMDYLARCQGFFWSIQHTFCSFECAIFLSKWLLMLAQDVVAQPLTGMEQEITSWIFRIVKEAAGSLDNMTPVGTSNLLPQDHLSLLGVAVVEIWMRQFEHSNTAWSIVEVVGESLSHYVSLLREGQAVNGQA